MLAPCISCNHGFSLRIAPLERVCAQCGALHVLQSGLWQLGSRSAASESLLAAARGSRQTAPRLSVVPSRTTSKERNSGS
jgi:hypothetical protein